MVGGKREHGVAQASRAIHLGTTARGGDLHCFWSSWWPAECDGAKITRRPRNPREIPIDKCLGREFKGKI